MSGKSILITGCSSGIGLTTALVLKERGYRVFATTRKEADVAKLKAMGFESFRLDVNDAISMQRALDEILKLTGGTLDALFNNAGYTQIGAVEDLSRNVIRAQFETNVFGAIELTNMILPIMRKQGHGRIIQNSSILGILATPLTGAYSASKFALEGFSSSLRQELRGTNIFVSIINPGSIESHLRDNAYQMYQQTLNQKQTGHYDAMYKRLEKAFFSPNGVSQKMALKPEAVAAQVVKALESSHPKAHYNVGMVAHMVALSRRILPDCILDWMLSKSG